MGPRAARRRVIFGPTLVLAMLAVSDSSAGPPQWPHARHDANGTNRAEGSALIFAPGFARTFALERRSAESAMLRDVAGDATPELLVPLRGSVAAFDTKDGSLLWQSPPRAIARLIAVDDFGGDAGLEVLAAAPGIGGGLYAFDAQTGALLSEVGGLPDKSGVDSSELALTDLTGDGRPDIVFTAAFPGLPGLWIASLHPGLGSPATLGVDFEGYAVLTPPRVGDFGPGGEPAIIVDQGSRHTVFASCTNGDPGSVCSEQLPTLCLCGPTVFEGVHSNFAFGTAHVGDVDGDARDELVTVATHALHSNSVTVLDLADGIAGGSPSTADFVTWSRRYEGNDPPTKVVAPAGPPRDVDGDGRVELAIGVVNDGPAETAWDGSPFPDGIDHPGAATLVLDAATGEVRASLVDEFPYGWADVDGNGQDELITSPAAGDEWVPGLRGRELVCDGGECSLSVVWNDDEASLASDLASLAGTSIPYGPIWQQPGDGALRTLDADDDGDPELVVYAGQWMQTLDVVGGVPTVLGSAQLQPDEQIVGVADGHVMSATGSTYQVRNADLVGVGPRHPLPLQGSGPVYAANLSENAESAALVFEGKVWPDPLAEEPPGPLPILPRFTLAEDLDGDGQTEIVSLRTPQDLLGPGFEVRVHEHVNGQLQLRWSTASDEHEVLDGYFSWGPLHFRSGDFDGEGARDVLLPVQRGSTWRIAVLDGDTGAVDHFLAPTTHPATFGPLLVADLAGVDGSPGPDGLDDVLLAGTSATQLLTVGVEGPVYSVPVNFGHHLNTYGDVDDDGEVEVVATLSATADNRMEVTRTSADQSAMWGPNALPRPSGHFEMLALAELDGEPGVDIAYGTGNGGVWGYRGTDGSVLPGFPMFVSSGVVLAADPGDARPVSALIALDADSDGVEELVVGTDEGWVYALNAAPIDADEGALFAVEIGDAVQQLAAADFDGDEDVEIAVSTTGALAIVLDELGVMLTIDEPDDCVETIEAPVLGTATGIASVELRVNGVLSGDLSPVVADTWEGVASFPGAGQFLLRAEGLDADGQVVAITTKEVSVGGDDDGDGWTLCGGDCAPEDPDVHPGAEEVCEDGVDQDCDGADDLCEGEDTGGDDSGGGDSGDGDGDETGGDEFSDDGYNMIPRGCVWCRIDSSPRPPPEALVLFGTLCFVLRRRRRRAA